MSRDQSCASSGAANASAPSGTGASEMRTFRRERRIESIPPIPPVQPDGGPGFSVPGRLQLGNKEIARAHRTTIQVSIGRRLAAKCRQHTRWWLSGLVPQRCDSPQPGSLRDSAVNPISANGDTRKEPSHPYGPHVTQWLDAVMRDLSATKSSSKRCLKERRICL